MFVKRRELPRKQPVTGDMLVKRYSLGSVAGNTSMRGYSPMGGQSTFNPMGRRYMGDERAALLTPVNIAAELMGSSSRSSLFGAPTRRDGFIGVSERGIAEDVDENGVPDMYEYNLKSRKRGKSISYGYSGGVKSYKSKKTPGIRCPHCGAMIQDDY